VLLRRYHPRDEESPPSADADTTEDAPQAEKPAGRPRSKTAKE
jgi:hypothetical protein